MSRGLSLAVLCSALLLPGAIAYVSGIAVGEAPSVMRSTPFLGAFIVLIAGVYWFATTIDGAGPAEIGFRNSGARSFLLAIPLTLFFVFGFGPLAFALVDWMGLGDFDAGLERFRLLPPWYLALTIVIVAGGEEWLYRGYAIERLEALTGSTSIAALISLGVFALVHLPLWGVGPAITTLLSGAILTVLYVVTRDVLALMTAHVATDLCGLLLRG